MNDVGMSDVATSGAIAASGRDPEAGPDRDSGPDPAVAADVARDVVETAEAGEPTQGRLPRGAGAAWQLGFGAVCVFAGLLIFWSGFHIDGHGSGDDFALYVNQARSLVQGDVGTTIGANRYAIDNSGWSTFSPYTYPWGLPLLLAPVLTVTGGVNWVTGVDYAPLKLVITATLAIALMAYFAMLRRRIPPIGAVLLPLFFATNFWYVTHTDQVLSEFPFLMCLMLFLVWLDRVRERSELDGDRTAPLVILGLIACYAFNTRREGLGTLLGLMAAQLVLIWDRTSASAGVARVTTARSLNWRALATPWATFIGATAAFQVLLPADLLPNYDARSPGTRTSLSNVSDNVTFYRTILAEQVGLKDAGPYDATLFGSSSLGDAAVVAVAVAVAIGLVACALTATRRDAAVVGTLLGVGGAVVVAPFHEYRYLLALLPLMMYFAYQGVAIPVRKAVALIHRDTAARIVGWPVVLTEIVLLGLIVGGWHDTRNAYEYRSSWVGPQAGPQEALALEMWAAVRNETRGDSVIVYNRARTANLYTGRLAVQGGGLEFMLESGDYYVMYLNSDGSPGDYSQYPLTDAEAAELGFTEVWRNAGFVIWTIPASSR